MPISHAQEKLLDATIVLLTGDAPLRLRLIEAATHFLCIGADDVPSIRGGQVFLRIKKDLTGEKSGSIGPSVALTVATLDDEQAGAIAKRIFQLFLMVRATDSTDQA